MVHEHRRRELRHLSRLHRVDHERASGAEGDREAPARVAAVRVEREARHVRPDGAEELAELGVVAQHVRRAEAVEDLVRVMVGLRVIRVRVRLGVKG